MLVRKIAGKALTKPATSGKPCLASIRQKPIANAAAIPRQPNISNGTLFSPLGAATLLRFNKTENKTNLIPAWISLAWAELGNIGSHTNFC